MFVSLDRLAQISLCCAIRSPPPLQEFANDKASLMRMLHDFQRDARGAPPGTSIASAAGASASSSSGASAAEAGAGVGSVMTAAEQEQLVRGMQRCVLWKRLLAVYASVGCAGQRRWQMQYTHRQASGAFYVVTWHLPLAVYLGSGHRNQFR